MKALRQIQTIVKILMVLTILKLVKLNRIRINMNESLCNIGYTSWRIILKTIKVLHMNVTYYLIL